MGKRRENSSSSESGLKKEAKEKRNGQWEKQDVSQESVEIRCPVCDYFLCEVIEIQGISVLKILCRYCRKKLILQLTLQEVLVSEL